jgi:methylmalonyl-CoA mutase N-terminal domain/subunit
MGFAQDRARWEKEVLKPFKAKSPERKEDFGTLSGIPFPAVETGPLSDDAMGRIGLPGAYPFTRGVYPTMYRGRLWTMRQYTGFGGARETNERFRYLLKRGQTGLSVAFDLPTQMGIDSDDPRAEGEVGKVGVAVDTCQDVRDLFHAIPLDRVSTSMTINATAPILLAMYLVLAKEQGADWKGLAGTVQNDILKEYIARGTYIYPPEPSLRLVLDLMAFCATNLPRWNSISVSGYHIREAGSTAVEELAFTLANGRHYLRAARERGLSPEKIARRVSFFFNAHNNFFEEIAKFRAARRIWASLLRDEFGCSDPRAQMMRFHTQTAGCTLTAAEPDNNVARVAYQALSAVMGGTQSLHTNSRDEALALPTAASATIALRTQQIVAFETGVADTVDPLAGSFFVENLTDRMEEEARRLMDEVEALGGATRAIEKGFFQAAIHRSAYAYQKKVEDGSIPVVAVNFKPASEEAAKQAFETLVVNREVGEQQTRRLASLRKERDHSDCKDALAALTKAAKGTDNLMPPILDAVKADATLGEISQVLLKVFGRYHEANLF